MLKSVTRDTVGPIEPAKALIRVAVVEDDANLRKTLELFISRSPGLQFAGGYGSAEEALKGLPSEVPDVVLMDIHLPGMSGIECVTRLTSLLPSVRALMLTAFEDSDDVFQSLKAGAFGYMLKSGDPFKLRDAIREVKQGGSPITGSIARKIVDMFRDGTAAAPATDAQAQLSPREVEILRYLSAGDSYKQIAEKIEGSINTVRTHIKRIYEKLHSHNRTEAVRIFKDRGGR
jgi:DNA-binding NarL/FixJ family response regulator